ncbi:septum formation family protein [Actinoplanes sp. CA-030573]|uniref:septum formation family protein n=1 Tax=Actinoplanes sp. CA-030573 TaxID=3239898 RepID=UPI003D93A9CF
MTYGDAPSSAAQQSGYAHSVGPWYGHASPNQRFDGFAIASFVLSLVGCGLLGLVLGIVALVRIERSGAKGRVLAIAALAVSSMSVVVVATVATIALIDSSDANSDIARQVTPQASSSSSSPSASSTVAGKPTEVSTYSLKVGDCILSARKQDKVVSSLPVVPCAEQHEAEVFAIFDLKYSSYPGEGKIYGVAERDCTERLGKWSRSAADDAHLELYVLYPSRDTWQQNDREVTCIANRPGKKSTGSLKD